MTRSVLIVGIIATLILTLGSPGLPIRPAGAADMMEADKAMMKATGEDLMSLKKELDAIRTQLEKITKMTGSMSKMVDKAVGDYCKSVPESVRAAGWVPGVCK